MEEQRPKLSDPKEFDIIRKIHLLDRTPLNEEDDIDPEERADRMKPKPINQAR